MEQLQSRRSRKTPLEIKNLLEEYTQAGISAKEFCRMHAITEARFYKWRTRHGDKSTEKQNAFVMLQESSTITREASLFAEVNAIKIYRPVAASYLKELLT